MKSVLFQKPAVILILLLIAVSLVNCQKQKEESSIDYHFPTRIHSISKQQRNGLTHTAYKIVRFYTEGQEVRPADSTFYFIEDGSVYNSKQKIGNWSEDGTLYLDYFKKKFYINWIGNWKAEGTNKVHLVTKYTEGKGKEVNEIRLYLSANPHSTQ